MKFDSQSQAQDDNPSPNADTLIPGVGDPLIGAAVIVETGSHLSYIIHLLASQVSPEAASATGAQRDTSGSSSQMIAPLIAFAGGLIGLILNGIFQRYVDRQHRIQVEVAARATAYAELWRLRREASSAIKFIEEDTDFKGGMIWIPIFRTLYPSSENLARISPLSAREVGSITSAYYIYQESMAFLKASALGVLPLYSPNSGAPVRRDPFFSLNDDVIEYVYTSGGLPSPGRRDEALKWLRISRKQVKKALREIESVARSRFPGSELALLIEARSGYAHKLFFR